MKKVCFAAAIILSFMLTGCGVQAEKPMTKTLRDQGTEFTVLLDELVKNDSYLQAFTVSGEILEAAEYAAEGDRTEPEAVYELVFTEESMEALIDEAGLTDVGGMSDDLKKNYKQKMLSAVITQMNAAEGTAKLAASAVCTVSKSFVNQDLQSDTIYVYTYPDALPVSVLFLKGNDGAVQGTAYFLMREELKGAGREKLEEYFSILSAELKEVQ